MIVQRCFTPKSVATLLSACANFHSSTSNDNYKKFSTLPHAFSYAKLVDRSLIRLKGQDVDQFLQGLLTNDVKNQLKIQSRDLPHAACLYSFMLNIQGRVLYDLFLYSKHETTNSNGKNQEILLECDSDLCDEVKKTLTNYRLRKKIEISRSDDEYQIFALFEDHANLDDPFLDDQLCRKNVDAALMYFDSVQKIDSLICCPDPRLITLGCRLILSKDDNFQKRAFDGLIKSDVERYRYKRYTLGIGEGRLDLPPGECLPLESNGDFLHAVNFHKGCYVGQELTARTHHTGVVRKRLMPLRLDRHDSNTDGEVVEPPTAGADVVVLDVGRSGEKVGKFRGLAGNTAGLALLRVDSATRATRLGVKSTTGGRPQDGDQSKVTSPTPLSSKNLSNDEIVTSSNAGRKITQNRSTEVFVGCTTRRPFWWPAGDLASRDSP